MKHFNDIRVQKNVFHYLDKTVDQFSSSRLANYLNWERIMYWIWWFVIYKCLTCENICQHHIFSVPYLILQRYVSGQGTKPLLRVYSAGEVYGLYLTLDAQQEYYSPSTQQAGFKILVHDQSEPPQDIANQGIAVPPGYRTSIALIKKEVMPSILHMAWQPT